MPTPHCGPPGWPVRCVNAIWLLVLMLAVRMSRTKMRSGMPSLPFGVPRRIGVDHDEAVDLLRIRHVGGIDPILMRIFGDAG